MLSLIIVPKPKIKAETCGHTTKMYEHPSHNVPTCKAHQPVSSLQHDLEEKEKEI